MDELQELSNIVKDAGEYFYSDDLPDNYEVVEEGDWKQEGKYQYNSIIIRNKESNRYFSIDSSRSGSYHTDWFYNDREVYEVQRVEKTVVTVTWKAL